VSDSGIGISAENQPRIFEHFYQVDGRAGQVGGGVGLGLAISSKLASLMSGVISVESTPGAGSVFRFDLPLRAACSLNSSNAQEANKEGAPQPLSTRPLRVLIVEDSPVNQLLARESLESAGHYVEVASDGREATLLLNAKEWDVAVIDIGLPDTTGWEVIRSVRERERRFGTPRLGIVVSTAHAGPVAAEQGRATDCDAVLIKPFTPRELQAIVVAVAKDHAADEPRVQAEPSTEFAEFAVGADEGVDLNWAFAVERLGGDEAMAGRLLQILLRELSAQRAELATLGRRRDRTRLKLLAHRLGGQVANFEAAKCAAALARLEAAAGDQCCDLSQPLAIAQATLERLAAEVRDKMAEVRDQRQEMPVP
jgi:two-component system sensor histidine kinase EvgS